MYRGESEWTDKEKKIFADYFQRKKAEDLGWWDKEPAGYPGDADAFDLLRTLVDEGKITVANMNLLADGQFMD